ncbi:DNA-3-methyladenine glycosylase [Oxalobacter sp. OxGP1]|uniref:DNA-3-methyladenine glycosylase n=1 Tax=Oxalobacter paeniformigenes TaxID=2946594 RepID=UPI0022AF8565|nr:DNA-3-methyladenine glycosylase [Oxalobacter paeniformigenes]MCZ4053297.1 DNA-3-methyladenine glycosylase [Oxalobacter paeniformigenes]
MTHVFGGIDFSVPPETLAQRLIGTFFSYRGTGGIIVETEAYDENDPASHSFCGPTTRNAVMFGPPGHLYVYRSYGIHWCVNFVCRQSGHGAAVLIRAIEPIEGIPLMQKRRNMTDIRLLCAGPGRLCQALGITKNENGLSLDSAFCHLEPAPRHLTIVSGPRIGISRAKETPWRFGLAGSPFLSKTFSRRPVTDSRS